MANNNSIFSSFDWNLVERRHAELNEQINSVSLDNNKRHLVQKEYSYLSTILNKHRDMKKLEQEYSNILALKAEDLSPEMQELFESELESIQENLNASANELELLMYAPDELDARSAFVEIRAGAGGQEASLFAGDLMKMYTNYALKHNWRVAITSSSQTDLGGFREVVLHIEGKNVFGFLKYESGVHRVQRVPTTEAAGRIHTSTATVAVLAEAEEVDVTVNTADLRIDVYRASGAGGQHVNTTDSAVRITHIPTGVVVTCQDERSQHKNKAKALKVLQSRILATQELQQESDMSKKRKELIGAGMRAEKVRTYNFPQNRVTDHQVNITLKKLDVVLEGNLNEIVEGHREFERKKRLKQLPKFLKK